MFKTEFFTGVKTLQDVKNRYRELAKKYHPDVAGEQSTETMKRINLEYEKVFEFVKLHPQTEQEQKTYKQANVFDGYREMILKVIHLEFLEIEICGTWVWIGGDTYPIKDYLKKSGFWYAGQKKKWYWHPEEERSNFYKGKKSWDMDRIRNTWGSEKIETEGNTKLPPKPKK